MNGQIIIPINMTFGEYLNQLRESRGITKVALSKKLGVTMPYISHIETGRAKPPTLDRCEQITLALNLNESEREKLLALAMLERTPQEIKDHFHLANRVNERKIKYKTKSNGKTSPIYILNSVPMGAIEPTADYVEGLITMDSSWVDSKDCFALRVKGNCLEDKGIFDKDIVIVSRHFQLDNGNIVVIRSLVEASPGATMKIWYKEKDRIILMPASKREGQTPIIINSSDDKKIEMIGKVICAMKDLR